MKMRYCLVASTLLGLAVSANAQLTPQDAVNGMMRGINIGNTMEPPYEGQWGNPPVRERAFDDYRNAGFTAVRIPITWDKHTSWVSPYTIDSTWIARVDTVVTWGMKRGFLIIINAHHETWLKTALSDTATDTVHAQVCIARFDSIWSQVATHFKDRSDSLIFEILNEPYPMSEANTDALNARVLKIIRETNPTRIVAFSGYRWSNSDELVTAAIPDSSDKYLIGYYHSYDPWPFGLEGPGTYGSLSDIAATNAKFDQVTTWSQRNGIPVILGEFGYINKCDYNSRMCAYGTVVDLALTHGVGLFAWDDGGGFAIYNRTTGGFNEIKDILIYTYPRSPNGLKINQSTGTSVQLQWHNRDTGSDSIVVQRRVGSGKFVDYTKLGPTDSAYEDTTTVGDSTYYYRLKIVREDSVEMESYPIRLTVIPTLVDGRGGPLRFELFDNYPNPFNPSTVISYQLSAVSRVSLRVYDVLGREVRTLVDGPESPGFHSVRFEASGLPSGVYFYRIEAGVHRETKKLVLLK